MTQHKAIEKFKNQQAQGSTRAFLEDLFEDYYRSRFRVYRMNFVRGIFFGLGSVLGGTVMITALLWALSFFNELPFIGRITQTVQHSIETSKASPQSR